ncbi:hypothetical protein HYT05_02230, partial [Candidatus Kaiserbacteria bacterium]|nr:hypothetical protein [Candidatus Kaiserbacteria bacterium]
MIEEILFDGVKYISASDAAEIYGFTRDYIGRLCREEKVRGKRVGKNWFIDQESFRVFIVDQEFKKSRSHQALSERRRLEYRNEYPVLSQREADPGTADADLFEQGEEKETQENRHILVNPIQDESAVLAANMGAFVHAPRSDILIPSHKLIVPKTTSDISASMKKSNIVLENAKAYFAKQEVRVITRKKDTPHYVPTYLLSPATLLFHKTLALVFAFMLTFGTYTVLYPQYALHAEQSIHEELASISGSYQKLATSIAPTQVVAASSLSSATLLGSVSGTLSSLAQGFSSSVDRFIYAIMFPSGATDSVARVDPVSGTVSINIAPYQGANQPAPAKAAQPISVAAKPKIAPTAPVRAPLTSPQPSQSAPAGTAGQTIVNNNTYPVIERIVERQALASAGGLTEAILNDRLQILDNKLTAQILSHSSANSTAIAQNYIVTAQSNAIHNLDNVTIGNPTITGGSISGTSVAATSLSISGNATTTSGGGFEISAGCFSVNGVCVSGGGAWPWIVGTNFATSTNATTTPTWFRSGLFASSTSQFVNASSS